MNKNNYNLYEDIKTAIISNDEARFLESLMILKTLNNEKQKSIINAIDNNGMCLLHYAFAHGKSSMAKLLLQYGASRQQCNALLSSIALLKYELHNNVKYA